MRHLRWATPQAAPEPSVASGSVDFMALAQGMAKQVQWMEFVDGFSKDQGDALTNR